MCDYLDSNRSIFAFRRVVPEELRPFIRTNTGKPRTEWRVSLKTTDRRIACERCRVEAVSTDKLLEKARADRAAWLIENAKTPEQKQRERQQWEAEIAAMEPSEDDLREEWEFDQREPERQALIGFLGKPRSELSTAELALRDLIPDDEFASPEAKAAKSAKIAREWAEGEAEFAAERTAKRALHGAKPSYPGIMEMFTDYAAEARLKPATQKRWKPVLARLVEFLKHDDASRVTSQNAIAWKDALLAEADKDGVPVRGNKTVREVFLAASKATFAWGVQNQRIEDNPFAKVTVRVRKRQKLRSSDFTLAEVLLILRSSLLPQSPYLSPEHALARRWVPWICAYTGARVNEITQMRAEDVAFIEGFWTIRITPEAGTVKTDEVRVIPLHADLVQQGFPLIASAKGTGPLFYDPARARGGSEAHPQYKKMGERLAAWVRSVGVDDPDVQPNHAWRHLFKTLARSLNDRAVDYINGHAPPNEGGKYGSFTIRYLAGEMAKFPKFEI